MNKDLLKEYLYKQFLKESKDQLTSAYKQRVTLSDDCNNWGGCWVGLPKGTSYHDIERLLCSDFVENHNLPKIKYTTK